MKNANEHTRRRLVALAGALRDDVPAPTVLAIAAALERAEAALARGRALQLCLECLDPGNTRSRWGVARDIAAGIRALNRVRKGRRLTDLETAYQTLATGRLSARRLHEDLLQI